MDPQRTKRIRISPKGQVTLPKPMRERYGLRLGTEAMAEPVEEGILIRPRVTSIQGLIPPDVDLEVVERELEELRSEWTHELEGEWEA